MMAVNSWTPNMPKLEMVNEPPWYSSGLSFPSLALRARDLTSEEIEVNPLAPTSLTMGVMRPVGVATATQISAFLNLLSEEHTVELSRSSGDQCPKKAVATHCRMLSPIQAVLASGTSARAKAEALTTDSICDEHDERSAPCP